MEEKNLKLFLEIKGIPEKLAPSFYLSFEHDVVKFVDKPHQNTSLGILPKFLIQRMLTIQNADSPLDQRETAHIRLKVGQQGDHTGFGARHILSCENHILHIDKYIKSKIKNQNECFSLVRFLAELQISQLAKKAAGTYVIALEQQYQRFILALETAKFGPYQHILIVLFPDGPDFIIGTMYPITVKSFNKIKEGDGRYLAIDIEPPIIELKKEQKVEEPTTYEIVTEQLQTPQQEPQPKKPTYSTTLDTLVDKKMVAVSECYLLFKIKDPTKEERKTFKLMAELSNKQTMIEFHIFSVYEDQARFLEQYKNAEKEVKEYLNLKEITVDFKITKLLILLRVTTQIASEFIKGVDSVGKEHDKLFLTFKNAVENISECINIHKLFGSIQDNFSDIFDYNKRDNKDYWETVKEKIYEHKDEITTSADVLKTINNCSEYSINFLMPLYKFLEDRYLRIKNEVLALYTCHDEVSDMLDQLNINVLFMVNHILTIFINSKGKGLIDNINISKLAEVIHDNSEQIGVSCLNLKTEGLLKVFNKRFLQYQKILMANGRLLMEK